MSRPVTFCHDFVIYSYPYGKGLDVIFLRGLNKSVSHCRSTNRKDVVAIIDDQPLVQISLKAVLKSMGCSVVCFTSPSKALEELEQEGPDCMLVDLMMPEMDGIEFIRQFRKRYSNDSVPIILSSSYLDNEMLGKAFEAGADDFLEKPANSELIRQRVRNMLRMRYLEICQKCNQSAGSPENGVSQKELVASLRMLEKNITPADSTADTDLKKAIHVATTALEKVCRDIGQMHPSIALPTLELKLSTFSPDSLMETCCQLIGDELEDKQLSLDCTLDSTLAWMVGDKKLLTGALTKMMTNVIHQSSRKARIGIRMKRVHGPAIEMSVRSSGSQKYVRDASLGHSDSMGIHPEPLGFDSCAREDAFCETVAAAHGGGVGSRFVGDGLRENYLTIPLYGDNSDVKNRMVGKIRSSVT